MNKWILENPERAKEFSNQQTASDLQDKMEAADNYTAFKLQSATVYTIPVVFHVIHMNGPENISDAQIMDALNVLNTDFRKLNSDTNTIVPEFKALAADVNFEFRLATKDEFGNCTNGITRHYDSRTIWDASLSNFFTTWDRTKYLNVYVVRNITVAGASAYTYMPGTAVPGYADAIVVRHDYCGSIGTSQPYTSRTLTHEVGHWFNLPHIWGGTNSPGVACGDDGVSDTPITKGFGWCNLINPKVCNPLIAENVQNYMDYSFCSRMFTIGQASRMTNSALSPIAGRNNLHTGANLIATGVVSPLSLCAPKVDFVANYPEVCVNGNISFTDLSYNGTVNNWIWKFQDGNAPVSGSQNPSTTFTATGKKQVFLKVSNASGTDSVTKTGITVLAGPGSGTINVSQGFESIVFPDNNWMSNTPQVGAGWIQTNTVGATGSSCVLIDNYFDSPSEPAVLFTPMYDISTLPSPTLVFKLAYSQNPSNSNDRLRVFYSSDCAITWNQVYNISGPSLHTLGTGSFATGPFLNPTGTQWREEVVGLSAAATANNLLIKFEFSHDSVNPGNNIFIDNINIMSTAGIDEHQLNADWIQVIPNPAHEKATVSFNLNRNTPVEMEIADVTGKTIFRNKMTETRVGKNKFVINLEQFTAGFYVVKLTMNDLVCTKKLIVN